MSLVAIAHRAGNSLPALAVAQQVGAPVVEADVQAVRGTLEVHHGRSLRPLPLVLDSWRVSHERTRRLHLTELVAALTPRTTVMLDLKDRSPEGAAAVAALLRRSPPAQPVWVCGRHWPAIEPFEALPLARTVLSARTRGELARLLPRLDADAARGVRHHGVSVHVSLVGPDVVAALLDRVELVMSWPVNSRRTLDTVTAAGVRGIITDSTPVLRHVVGQG